MTNPEWVDIYKYGYTTQPHTRILSEQHSYKSQYIQIWKITKLSNYDLWEEPDKIISIGCRNYYYSSTIICELQKHLVNRGGGTEFIYSSGLNLLIQIFDNLIDFNISSKRMGIEEIEKINSTGSSCVNSIITLMAHQIRTINSFNFESGIVCHPTGTGKTITAMGIIGKYIREKNKPVLWITQRKDVLNSQFTNTDKIKACIESSILPDINVLERYLMPLKSSDFQISGSTLLITNIDKFKHDKRYEKFDTNQFGLIILDECHSVSAELTYEMLKYFNSIIVGFSATPIKDNIDKYIKAANIFGDGKYINFIDRMSLIDAISDNLIVPPDFYWLEVVNTRLNKSLTDDFNCILNYLNKIIIMSATHKGVLWCNSKISADIWYTFISNNKYNYTGLSEYEIFLTYSGTNNPKIKNGISSFINYYGSAIIIAVDQCKEGFDHPQIDFVACLEPVENRSFTVFIQQVGRAVRNYEGKTRGLILDTFTNLDEEDKITQICSSMLIYYQYLNWADNKYEEKPTIHVNIDKKYVYIPAGTRKIKFHISTIEERSLCWTELEERISDYLKNLNFGKLQYKDIVKLLADKPIDSIQDYLEVAKKYDLPDEPHNYFTDFNWSHYLSLYDRNYYSYDECLDKLREIFINGYNPFDMNENYKYMTDTKFPPYDFIADYYEMDLCEIFSKL